MSAKVSIAYWLGRIMPVRLDVDNDTDSFFFSSEKMRSASEEMLERRLISSAQWRYDYERRNRTLDYMFAYPIESLLRNKVVLDFGCFLGGTTVAWFEQYGFSKALGFDTEPLFASGANLFARLKGANAEFVAARGENLPYPDDHVDAIISVDVFEHVNDVAASMRECWRVLRSGGHLLAIFPPYYNPLTHHLKISNTPFLHWIFSGETLRQMQNRRYLDYGDSAKHFNVESLNGYRAPGLNGVTVRQFTSLIHQGGWEIVADRRKAFPSVGERARSHWVFRAASRCTQLVAGFPFAEEIAVDHLAFILRKP